MAPTDAYDVASEMGRAVCFPVGSSFPYVVLP